MSTELKSWLTAQCAAKSSTIQIAKVFAVHFAISIHVVRVLSSTFSVCLRTRIV